MSLSKEEVSLILELIDLALQYGIPAVRTTIEFTGKEILTQDDIDNMKIEKDFEDY